MFFARLTFAPSCVDRMWPPRMAAKDTSMRYNPERRAWRGVSHKTGRRVRDMRYALVGCD